MTVALVYVSDRQDKYLPACRRSVTEHLHGWDFELTIDDRDHRLGLAGAVQQGWKEAVAMGADYVWHMEEDFLLTDDIRIDEMIWILEHHPHLAQIVLKRQPWSPEEVEAGGIIERAPHMYVERRAWGRHIAWTEHHQIFSLNPCLIPKKVLEIGWPAGNEAEMTEILIEDMWRFAFFGGKDDPPRCVHVGSERSVGWRL